MGTVVISLDAELAWGFHDLPDPPRDRVRRSRRAWERLVALFDEYDVPATWAVVGHLCLDSCDGTHGDHAAPEGWFARDPGGGAAAHPLWFGRDLIDAVRDADAGHELASHTFSHVEFGAEGTTREVAAAELAACRRLADERELSMTSLVFPRNRVGHRDLLPEYGFETYRGVAPARWFETSPLRPVGKLADATVGSTAPPLVSPTVDEYGLVNVPASLYLFDFEGVARSVVETVAGDPVVRWARRGIDRAAREDGVFHMWLHPNNLTAPRDFDRMRAVLDRVARRRAETGLTVETMADVAARAREARGSGVETAASAD